MKKREPPFPTLNDNTRIRTSTLQKIPRRRTFFHSLELISLVLYWGERCFIDATKGSRWRALDFMILSDVEKKLRNPILGKRHIASMEARNTTIAHFWIGIRMTNEIQQELK